MDGSTIAVGVETYQKSTYQLTRSEPKIMLGIRDLIVGDPSRSGVRGTETRIIFAASVSC